MDTNSRMPQFGTNGKTENRFQSIAFREVLAGSEEIFKCLDAEEVMASKHEDVTMTLSMEVLEILLWYCCGLDEGLNVSIVRLSIFRRASLVKQILGMSA
ncbi:hypothetical protein Trydic_g14863 [Trypoxylus dichotomus]